MPTGPFSPSLDAIEWTRPNYLLGMAAVLGGDPYHIAGRRKFRRVNIIICSHKNSNLYIYLFLVNEEFCIISWCRCRRHFLLSPLLLLCDKKKCRYHGLIKVLWRHYLYLAWLQVNQENNVSKILALQRLIVLIIEVVTYKSSSHIHNWIDDVKCFRAICMSLLLRTSPTLYLSHQNHGCQ